MSAMSLESIKDSLSAEKARLEKVVERTSKHLYRRDEPYSADFAEQAVEVQNNEVVENIDQSAQLELKQINRALARIENGDYGSCTRCGNAIPNERLTAIPYTEFCIDCVQDQER